MRVCGEEGLMDSFRADGKSQSLRTLFQGAPVSLLSVHYTGE